MLLFHLPDYVICVPINYDAENVVYISIHFLHHLTAVLFLPVYICLLSIYLSSYFLFTIRIIINASKLLIIILIAGRSFDLPLSYSVIYYRDLGYSSLTGISPAHATERLSWRVSNSLQKSRPNRYHLFLYNVFIASVHL